MLAEHGLPPPHFFGGHHAALDTKMATGDGTKVPKWLRKMATGYGICNRHIVCIRVLYVHVDFFLDKSNTTRKTAGGAIPMGS